MGKRLFYGLSNIFIGIAPLIFLIGYFKNDFDYIVFFSAVTIFEPFFILSGIGILLKNSFGYRISKMLSIVSIVVSSIMALVLIYTISYVYGIYNHVGKLEALLVTVILFIYIVLFFAYPILLFIHSKNYLKESKK